MSMPQIIMLTHASHVSYERMKLRQELDSKKDKNKPVKVMHGKTIDQLNSDELMMYYSGGEGFGQVTIIDQE